MRVMTIDSLNGLRGGLGTSAAATALDRMNEALYEAEGLYTPFAEAMDRGDIPLATAEKLQAIFDELRDRAEALSAAGMMSAQTSIEHDQLIAGANDVTRRTNEWIRAVRKALGIGGLWMVGAVAVAALVFGGAAAWAVSRRK